jgi:hypothetical protein
LGSWLLGRRLARDLSKNVIFFQKKRKKRKKAKKGTKLKQ